MANMRKLTGSAVSALPADLAATRSYSGYDSTLLIYMGEYSKEIIGSGTLSPYDSLSSAERDPATQTIHLDTQSTTPTEGEDLREQVPARPTQLLHLYFKLLLHYSSTRASSPINSSSLS